MRAVLRPLVPLALALALVTGTVAPAEAAPVAPHTAVIGAKHLRLAKPRIVGQHVVGAVLIVSVKRPAGSRLTYQWRSNGHVVKKATRSWFRVRRADKGHRISVTVTAKRKHTRTVRRTSAAVRIVVPDTRPPAVPKPPVSPVPPVAGPVTYSSASAPIGRDAVVDTRSGLVYSLHDAVDADGRPTIALTATNAASRRIEQSTTLFSFWDADSISLWDRDVRVDNRRHVVWVLAGGSYGSYVLALDGRTLGVQRIWFLDRDAGTLAVDPATGIAYTAGAAVCGDNDEDLVASFDADHGSVTTVRMPTPGACYSGLPNVAFDSANNGVYVAFAGRVFAYSHRLALASTLTLPWDESSYSLGITANGDRHTIYVTGARLYEIAGSSNTISRTAPISSVGRVPVIDPRIDTLYVGDGVYDTDSLGRVGTLPGAAESVDGGSHTIYGTGRIITRIP